ncbi:MAG: Fur family transcriptional regulator [Candidatus Marinimicrobia bacterium]|nr:Fur family transcriptional regulator [Candidatus Neomarinimicrobiota bacterium]
MKHIQTTIKDKGIKPTYQRLKILEYLIETKKHPTVEMIYNNMKRVIPTISKTTIYNTMNSFVEKGILNALSVTGTELRYDANISPHHHFLCKKCGKLYDIQTKATDFYDKKVIDGNKIDEVHVYFKGICKKCLDKGNYKN